MAEDNMYLENLKEFVFEEDKIVTYKWLSRTLAVNVNQAKQMLFSFVQNTHEQHCLNITYMIGGVIKNDKGQHIKKYLFADDKELKDMKKCFDQLTTLHIYSIQKNQLKDSSVLYTVDYDLQKQNLECSNRWSNITCNSAVFKANDDMKEVNVDDFENKEPISNGISKKIKTVSPEPAKSQSKSVKSSSTKNDKSKNNRMKKGDVASFFSKQTNNSKEACDSTKNTAIIEEKEKKNENQDNQEDDELKKNEPPPQVDTKQREKGRMKSVENTKKEIKKGLDNETEGKSVEKIDKDQGEKKKRKKSPNSEVIVADKSEGKRVKRNKSKISSDEKKTGDDFENQRKGKKRRRVKEFSESSDEEEDMSIEINNKDNTVKLSGVSEDSVPIPDQQLTENKITEESNNSETKRRKRKRVLKSKTFLNDEGYMVTEKVYESESTDCSDVEEKPKIPVKENMNKATTKSTTTQKSSVRKNTVTKATKQSSLTSFFKKT